MAQKVQVLLVDDLDGGEASETVSFALDGSSYEIDLSGKNAEEMRDALAKYVGAARKAGRTTATSSSRSSGVDGWVASYREQIEQSRAVVASMDLDSPCARTDIIECNVRYVMFHMIQETARHAGHADIIRETLDGSTGI